jgi:ribosomal protein L22
MEKTKQQTQILEKTAIVNGKNLPVGLKHAIALSKFIRGKDIDVAIKQLEDVARMRMAIPMAGEIPHRRGMNKTSGSGRYPVKGAGEFIRLLKSLKANAIVKEIELEKYVVHAIPNNASRPYKRFGQGRMKRCHVTIKLIAKKINTEKSKEKK